MDSWKQYTPLKLCFAGGWGGGGGIKSSPMLHVRVVKKIKYLPHWEGTIFFFHYFFFLIGGPVFWKLNYTAYLLFDKIKIIADPILS